MSNESFGSIIVAFILIASVISYLDISGGEKLIALIGIILCLAYFIQPSDDPFET